MLRGAWNNDEERETAEERGAEQWGDDEDED